MHGADGGGPPTVEPAGRRIPGTGEDRPRARTQAERRAATRTALLEAAVVCLAESGYEGASTRAIAARAGLSQAAQRHYFASKQDLLIEAMRHAVVGLTQASLGRLELEDLTDADRQRPLIDGMWALHRTVVFRAGMELAAASRFDAELGREVHELERGISRSVALRIREVVESDAIGPVLAWVETALATIRGLVLLGAFLTPEELEHRWAHARPQLVLALRAAVASGDDD